MSLLAILISSFVFYSYWQWQKLSSREVIRIQQSINTNFEQYGEIIKLIEHKAKNGGVDFKKLLDAKRYNQLFGLQKGYINVSDIYLVNVNEDSRSIYTKFGKESFAILPSKEFFSLLEANGNASSTFLVERNLLYVGKRTKENTYLLLKVDIGDIIQGISSLLNPAGTFSISNAQGSIDLPLQNTILVPLNHSITLNYVPQDFFEALRSKSDTGLAVLMTLLLSLLLWAVKTKQLFKKVTKNFSAEQTYLTHNNVLLKEEVSSLSDYCNNLEASLMHNKKFCYNLLLLYAPSISKYLNMPTDKKEGCISLSKILDDCKSILYPNLYKSQVECTIQVSTEVDVGYEQSANIFVILLNLLFKSIYKTPKKGRIKVMLTKKDDQPLIKIEDNAFDLTIKDHSLDKTDNIFLLSDMALNLFAENCGIIIIKNPGDQANITDLIITNGSDEKSANLVSHGNIIHFPGNV